MGDSVAPTARTAQTVLPGVAMIAVTFGLARYGYGLLLPEMQSELAVQPGTAGLISSGAYVSYLAANFSVVWLGTRFGPRLPVAIAAGLAAGGMVVIATAAGSAALALGVLIAGAAAGLAFPPYADIVAQHVPQQRRALAWSAISSGTGWGVAIAGPISIALGSDWRVAWFVFTGLAVVVGVFATRAAPPLAGTSQEVPRLSWTWFVCPRSRPLLLSSVLVGLGSSVWWAFSVDALRTAGLDETPSRAVYAVCGAAGILASASGAVISRLGLRTCYLASCITLATSLVVLGAAADSLVAALLTAVLFGVSYNAVIATQGLWSGEVFAQRPSAGLAAVNTALTIGTIIGPSIAGTTIHHLGYSTALSGAAVVVVLAVCLCPPGRRRREVLARHRCTARLYAADARQRLTRAGRS